MGSLTAQAIWTLSYGAGLLMTDVVVRSYAEALAWVGMNWVGPLFLGFALEYTGRTNLFRTRWSPLLVLGPAATTALALTHRFHGLLWMDFRVQSVFGLTTVQYTIEPLGYVTVMASLAMAGTGVLLIVETVHSYGRLYRREALAVTLSPLPATVPLLVWLGQIGPWPALNLTPAFLLSHVALDAYAFTRTDMFESNPVTQRAAAQSAIDDLEDPLLVVDTQDRVVHLNDSAQRLFDTDEAVLPRPLSTLTGAGLATLRDDGELEITSPQRRVYAVSYTSLSDPQGEDVGGIVVLYDITAERQRKQHLSVVNRVLRHNLRNEMTVIRGQAQSIRTNSTGTQFESQGDSIIDASDRLLSIAENIRASEGLIEDGADRSTVDAAALAEGVVSDIRARYPAATVSLHVDDAVEEFETDPDVLALALENVVENAAAHAGGDAPTVDVRLYQDDGATVVEVADTNDRIPEMETASLLADEAQPLQHGRGLGLWTVDRCVTALDGEVRFSYDDGNVVRLVLPDSKRPHIG